MRTTQLARRHPHRFQPCGELDLKMLALLALGAVVCVGVLFAVFAPGPSYALVETRPVDALIAASGIQPKVAMEPGVGVLKFGGDGKLVVLRDNPNGPYVKARLRISDKFLNDNGAVQLATIVLNSGSIQLASGGGAVTPLFLTSTHAETVDLDMDNVRRPVQILPADVGARFDGAKSSYGVDGELVSGALDAGALAKLASGLSGNVRFVAGSKNGVGFSAVGNLEFASPTGITVRYRYEGRGMSLTWSSGCAGWTALSQTKRSEDAFTRSVEVTCLFPRPAAGGDVTLKVLGGPAVAVAAGLAAPAGVAVAPVLAGGPAAPAPPARPAAGAAVAPRRAGAPGPPGQRPAASAPAAPPPGTPDSAAIIESVRPADPTAETAPASPATRNEKSAQVRRPGRQAAARGADSAPASEVPSETLQSVRDQIAAGNFAAALDLIAARRPAASSSFSSSILPDKNIASLAEPAASFEELAQQERYREWFERSEELARHVVEPALKEQVELAREGLAKRLRELAQAEIDKADTATSKVKSDQAHLRILARYPDEVLPAPFIETWRERLRKLQQAAVADIERAELAGRRNAAAAVQLLDGVIRKESFLPAEAARARQTKARLFPPKK